MKRNKLAISLAALLYAPIAGIAFAQSAPTDTTTGQQSTTDQSAPNQNNSKQLQTIVVTGSAIPRIDAETSSPVTVITRQQIDRSGLTTLSDVVRAVSADVTIYARPPLTIGTQSNRRTGYDSIRDAIYSSSVYGLR